MHAPQIIFVVWALLVFGCALAMHGKSQGTCNAGAKFIFLCWFTALLYWGGFFSQP